MLSSDRRKLVLAREMAGLRKKIEEKDATIAGLEEQIASLKAAGKRQKIYDKDKE